MTTYGVTNIHPLALLVTLLAGIFLLTARRSQATLAVALVACLIPLAQRVVIAGLNFPMIRLVILFGWLRLATRGELRALRLNAVDRAFIAWILIASSMYVIREGTSAALVYRLGLSFDGLGIYLLFRMLLRGPSDTVQLGRHLALCSALVAVPMALEWATGRNLFSIFGGVPAMTMIREGRLRCQGAFSHPIMAGSFGATVVPLFLGMYFAFPARRAIAILGAVSGAVIAVASASSGPLLSLVVGIGAFALWRVRRHTRAMRWGLVAVLTFVHFARERPVWHLFVALSGLMGGEGYHRYALIDAFIRNWREWFLAGTPDTNHWGFMLWDTTNQYVQEGVTGGVLALVSFVLLMGFSFRGIGIARAVRNGLVRPAREQGFWCWGVGCSLFSHTIALISVSYYGQMQVLFYVLFALISAEFTFATVAAKSRTRALSVQLAAMPQGAPGRTPAS